MKALLILFLIIPCAYLQTDYMLLTSEATTLTMNVIEDRYEYLLDISDADVVCYEEETGALFHQNTLILKPGDDVYNLGFKYLVENSNTGERDHVDYSLITISEYNSTHIGIDLKMTPQDLKDMQCHMAESDKAYTFTCPLRIEFFATEDSSHENMRAIYSILTVITDRQLSATTELQTEKLAELTACECTIRVDVETALEVFADASFENLVPISGSGLQYELNEVAYFQQYLTDEQQKKVFDLKYFKVIMTYSGYSIDITDKVINYCEEYENNICPDGSVYLGIRMYSLSEDISFQLFSLISSKDQRRRMDDSLEATLTQINVSVQTGDYESASITTTYSYNQEIIWWPYVLMGVLGIIFIILLTMSIRTFRTDKLLKHKQTTLEGSTPSADEIESPACTNQGKTELGFQI